MSRISLCHCCHRTSHNEPRYTICGHCLDQWKIISRLYTVAAGKFPSIKKYLIGEFVLVIWEKLGLDKPKDLRYTIPPKTGKPK